MLAGRTTRHPARGAVLAAVASLALAGCAGPAQDAPLTGSDAVAATVDGRDISVGDVQRSTRELRAVLQAQAASSGQQPQQLQAADVVTLLAQAPAVSDFAAEEGIALPSAGSIRKSLAPVLPSPSQDTVEFLRANAVSSQIDESTRERLIAHLDEQKVTLSPRYAASTGTPDWLEKPVEEQLPTEAP